MAYGLVNDKLHGHPKFVNAGPDASGIWLWCHSWVCDNLTDGFIPRSIVERFCGSSRRADDIAKKLIECGKPMFKHGLWELREGGYQMHDYLDWNPSAEEVRAKREAEREKKERYRNKKRNRKTGQFASSPVESPNMSTVDNPGDTLGTAPIGDEGFPPYPTPTPTPTPSVSSETDISLSRALARNGPWDATSFRRVWESVTEKAGGVRGDVLIEAAARVADAARVAGRGDVEAFAGQLIAAFPKTLEWLRRQQLQTPAVSVTAFLEDKHFARCEDVVAGRLDLTLLPASAMPRNGAPPAPATPNRPPVFEGKVTYKDG